MPFFFVRKSHYFPRTWFVYIRSSGDFKERQLLLKLNLDNCMCYAVEKGDNIWNFFLIFYLERMIYFCEIFIGASISKRNLLPMNTILSYSDSEHFSTFAAVTSLFYLEYILHVHSIKRSLYRFLLTRLD